MKKQPYFNMQAAKHNEHERKKNLYPEYLFKRLARLTGEKDGRGILKVILKWKRERDRAMEINSLIEKYGEEMKFYIFNNKKIPPVHSCKVCGRKFKMKGWRERFSVRDKRLCKECERGWRSRIGQLAPDGSRMPMP